MNPAGAIQLSPARAPDAPGIATPRREKEFERLLTRAESSHGPGPGASEAREAAEDFVALAFIEPILELVRESSQAAPPFAPTSGEKQFRAMLDADLAREITRAARFPLVERLARQLRGHGSTEAHTTADRA